MKEKTPVKTESKKRDEPAGRTPGAKEADPRPAEVEREVEEIAERHRETLERLAK